MTKSGPSQLVLPHKLNVFLETKQSVIISINIKTDTAKEC